MFHREWFISEFAQDVLEPNASLHVRYADETWNWQMCLLCELGSFRLIRQLDT